MKIANYINIVSLPPSLEKFNKWRDNNIKLQKEKAEEIYKLVKQLKQKVRNNPVLDEIEKKVLEYLKKLYHDKLLPRGLRW